jgi:response regulator RpfG family c-di-GMP phosphodiesterase/GGDEF domain-containing protein
MRVSPRGRRTAAVAAVTLAGAATVALGAFAGLGIWLVAAIGGGLLGAVTTLTAIGISAAARGTLAPGRDARIDPVTELPDAERLRADLDSALSRKKPERTVLSVYALDGLKPYNDAYGEACGDALLGWLARRLDDTVGARGTVYRMRGACFAVLAAGPEEVTAEIRADASSSLFEVGDGFAIWSSAAEVSLLPLHDLAGADVLELADRRAHVPRSYPSAEAELRPPDDPIDALPLLPPRYDVGELARRIGRRIGVPAAELDDLEAAAELRDVGNVAVPSAVLIHAGELPGHEWRFVRLHTIVGERLLAAGFRMDQAAKLVRCSHERWDGSGYPDGLSGEDIPLRSRIVFVCGAFEDMTTERPHRPALGAEAALAELDRAAGTQFDPGVVSAFHEAFSAERDLVRSERALHARRPLRVLVAGADPVARFLLRREVEAAGHQCDAVADGLSAWETYCRVRPEVVISDLLMPQLGGIELCRRIRARDAQQSYVVILVGADGRKEVRRGMRADADAVLSRPLDRIDLEVTLSKAGAVTASRHATTA